MAATKMIALSYLSQYKLGSPSSTTKGLDSSPTYNQDRTWFNIHATYYIKFTITSPYIGVQLKLLQTKFKWSSSGSKYSLKWTSHTIVQILCQFTITTHKSIKEELMRSALPRAYSSSTMGQKQFLHYPWYTVLSTTSGEINPKYKKVLS